MLPIQLQIQLKIAAKKKDYTLLNLAIAQIKADNPSYFFGGNDDPNLHKRVFFHVPFGSWSGKAIVNGRATKYQNRF